MLIHPQMLMPRPEVDQIYEKGNERFKVIKISGYYVKLKNIESESQSEKEVTFSDLDIYYKKIKIEEGIYI